MEIVYLEEVEFDLHDGRDFYDQQQPGIGEYFVDSIIADAESLSLYAGVHSEHFVCSERHFLLPSTILSMRDELLCAILDMRRDPAWLRAELENRSAPPG